MARAHRHGLRKICECKPSAWAKCPHAWHFSYRWKGVRYRCSLDRQLGKPVRLKTDAESAANDFRSEIQAGTFKLRVDGDTPAAAAAGGDTTSPVLPTLTLSQLLETYRKEYVAIRRPGTLKNDEYQIAVIARTVLTLPNGEARAFGQWCVADIKANTLEQFRAVRLPAGKFAANRNLALLRAAFGWAVRLEHVAVTPFKRGTETIIKLDTEAKRSRRLAPGEGDTLLAACGPTLRPIVEAALETGCRRGELLSLQWKQVRLDSRGELFLPGQKTKTKKDRRVPISARLRSILEMRRCGADGEEHPPDAYVFGDPETGQRVRSFKRAWEKAVLRAHGIKPSYLVKVKDGRKVWTATLTPESRAELRRIDLHFHDLRREAGSRWLDSSVVPLTAIRDWLGHSNISQTSTYLECQVLGQNDLMRRFEEQQAALAKLGNAGGKRGHQRPQAGTLRDARAPKGTGRHQVQ